MFLPSSLRYFSKLTLAAKLLGFVYLFQVVNCDGNKTHKYFAASIVSMEPLLETERQLLCAMENYTILWERKLSVIRGAIAEMRAENKKSEDNAEEYLSNPINSYALIRRLHEDWVKWQIFLQSSLGADEINKIQELRAETPNSIDFSEAVEGIYHLQVVAGLSPADMAVGILNGQQYDKRFTAKDCYSIGLEFYSKNYFNLSEIWLNISLQMFQDEYSLDKAKVYETYARALQMQGRFTEALEAINNALHINPYCATFLQVKNEIEFEIQTEIMTELKAEIMEKQIPPGKYEASSHRSECLNADTSTYASSKLYCVYNRTASPFLYLAPFKMEIVNLDPYIILYHDVIDDTEIASMKQLSIPKLKRARVFNTVKQEIAINGARVAHNIYVDDDTNDVTKRMNQRIAEMTGFSLEQCYRLNINNYGLGGNFQPHIDYHTKPNVVNHVATVLIYMSDVEQGGATVFPKINVTVRPQKGSALVWYNLDNAGDGDPATEHTSCPVIVGSKWVIIKMITEYGQIFRVPCHKEEKK